MQSYYFLKIQLKYKIIVIKRGEAYDCTHNSLESKINEGGKKQ